MFVGIILGSLAYWEFQIFQFMTFLIFVYYVIHLLEVKTDGLPSKIIRVILDFLSRRRK